MKESGIKHEVKSTSGINDIRPVTHSSLLHALSPDIRRKRLLLFSLLTCSILSLVVTLYWVVEKELARGLEENLKSLAQSNARAASLVTIKIHDVLQETASTPATKKALVGYLLALESPESNRAQLLNARKQAAASLPPGYWTLTDRKGDWLNLSQRTVTDCALPLQRPASKGPRGAEAAPQLISAQCLTPLYTDPETPYRPIQNSRSSLELQLFTAIDFEGQFLGYLGRNLDRQVLSLALRVSSFGNDYHAYAYSQDGRFLTTPTIGSYEAGSESPVTKWQQDNPSLTESSGTSLETVMGLSKEQVVRTWTWLPMLDFGIMTEIPTTAAFRSLAIVRRALLALIVLLGAALFGFIGLGRWTLRARREASLAAEQLSRLTRAIQPLSAALDHDPSAVILLNSQGEIVYANAASHRILAHPASLVSKSFDDAFSNLSLELQEALESRRETIVAQTGSQEPEQAETLLVSSKELRIDHKVHVLYMLRPITQQLRRNEVENWKKLIRIISHEINNSLAPITSLLSSAKKIAQKPDGLARLDDIFTKMNQRVEHLLLFLEGYGTIARLPKPSPKRLKWDYFIRSLEAQSTFKLRGKLPQEDGYFDPVQLERVVLNLIKNAKEASLENDPIELKITQEDDGALLEVLDQGSGMSEKVLEQAMLPFFSTKSGGTGIGLSLSREIIEAHHGRMSIANRRTGGLRVACFLPNPPQVNELVSRSFRANSPKLLQEAIDE